MYEQSHDITLQEGVQTILQTLRTYQADAQLNIDTMIDGESADQQIHFACPASGTALVALGILADGPVTLSTNDTAGGTPDDTLVLEAGKPRLWGTDDAGKKAPIFVGNVATIYADVPGTDPVRLQIYCLFNAKEPGV